MWEIIGYVIEFAIIAFLVTKCRQWYYCCLFNSLGNRIDGKEEE